MIRLCDVSVCNVNTSPWDKISCIMIRFLHVSSLIYSESHLGAFLFQDVLSLSLLLFVADQIAIDGEGWISDRAPAAQLDTPVNLVQP